MKLRDTPPPNRILHDVWLAAMGVTIAMLLLALPHELRGTIYRPLLPWLAPLGWAMATSAAALTLGRLGPGWTQAGLWPGRVLGILGVGTLAWLLLPSATFEGLTFLLVGLSALLTGEQRWRRTEVWGGVALGAVATCALVPPAAHAWLTPLGIGGGILLAVAPATRRWRLACYGAALLAALLVTTVPDQPIRWLGSAVALGTATLAVCGGIGPWLPPVSQVYGRLLRGLVGSAILPLAMLGIPALLALRANEEQHAYDSMARRTSLMAAFVADATTRATLTLASHATTEPSVTSDDLADVLRHAGPAAGFHALWRHDATGQIVASTSSAPPPVTLPALPGPLPSGAAVSPVARQDNRDDRVLAVLSVPLADGGRLSASYVLPVPQTIGDRGEISSLVLRNAGAAAAGLRTATADQVLDDGSQRWLVAETPIAGTPWLIRGQEPLGAAYRNLTIVTVLGGTSALLAVLALVLIAAAITKSITRPLRTLEDAFADLAGDRPARVKIATGDELERLGTAFNTLAIELQRSRAALTELNRTLEERIDERTSELASAQAQLERYAADIRAAYRAERARSREVEEFVYSVSHDLKTPLVSIQSYGAAIGRGDLDDETQQRYLERLQRNAEHMERLMQALLELARAGTVTEPRVPIDTRALVCALCETQPEPQARQVTFVVGTGLPTIVAERGKIERVFANLIDNAVKFLGPRPDARVEIGAESSGATWCFWVRDNGPGIPSQAQDRVFRPFVRMPGSEAVPGSGMGLALVQKIVRAHGGDAWIESVEDTGTTVYFTVPRYPDDDGHGASDHLPLPAAGADGAAAGSAAVSG